MTLSLAVPRVSTATTGFNVGGRVQTFPRHRRSSPGTQAMIADVASRLALWTVAKIVLGSPTSIQCWDSGGAALRTSVVATDRVSFLSVASCVSRQSMSEPLDVKVFMSREAARTYCKSTWPRRPTARYPPVPDMRLCDLDVTCNLVRPADFQCSVMSLARGSRGIEPTFDATWYAMFSWQRLPHRTTRNQRSLVPTRKHILRF